MQIYWYILVLVLELIASSCLNAYHQDSFSKRSLLYFKLLLLLGFFSFIFSFRMGLFVSSPALCIKSDFKTSIRFRFKENGRISKLSEESREFSAKGFGEDEGRSCVVNTDISSEYSNFCKYQSINSPWTLKDLE